MREIRLVPPELGLIAVTRGILGIGIGLLLAGKLRRRGRMRMGVALTAIGAVSTIPLAIRVLRRHRTSNGQTRSPLDESAFAT